MLNTVKIQIEALLSTRFSNELLYLSIKHRLYLHPHMWGTPLPQSIAYCVLAFAIVVEGFSVRDFPADYPLYRRLGFNHTSSYNFFLLS